MKRTFISQPEGMASFCSLYCKYECLFTCPPYGLKELWNEHETNYTCDMWIAQCITRYDCKKYLFVVDSSERYKDYIIDEITNSSHFGNRKEYIVLITQ